MQFCTTVRYGVHTSVNCVIYYTMDLVLYTHASAGPCTLRMTRAGEYLYRLAVQTTTLTYPTTATAAGTSSSLTW